VLSTLNIGFTFRENKKEKFIMKMLKKSLLTLAFLSVSYTNSVLADDSLRKDIAVDYAKNLESMFIHFHKNPELSFLESKTAARLAKELSALGYDVTEGVGRTGVVAVIKNGAGPTVMLRADMDGLPVKEDTGLSYASTAKQIDLLGKEQHVMHACGHDVHITSLVGAARQMAARTDNWSGTLVLIVQPAEELISGAREMLEDGLYTKFPKPDYALAFHVSADVPTGKIGLSESIVSSSSDSVDIQVRGIGAHGASPHSGVDPVLVASQIVVTLQSVVSRSIAPLEAGVITVGSIHGGNKHNIIGDRVDMQLTVRSNNHEVREQLLDGIDRVSEGVAKSLNVPDTLLPIVTRSPTQKTPPTINDGPTAVRVKSAFVSRFGEDILWTAPRQGMGAEDFAYFVTPELGVKGVYFSVGGTKPEDLKTAPSHHSPFFKIEPEASIKLGTEAMVTAAMELLK
jgi:hippurate hydrolase